MISPVISSFSQITEILDVVKSINYWLALSAAFEGFIACFCFLLISTLGIAFGIYLFKKISSFISSVRSESV